MLRLVIFTGRTGTGKSTLAAALQQSLGFLILHTTDIIRDEAARRGRASDRLSLQELGDLLDGETDHRWPLEAVAALSEANPSRPIAVDNLRHWPQLLRFREWPDWRIAHVHLEAPMGLLEQRFADKRQHRSGEAALAYKDADLLKDPADVRLFQEDADLRLATDTIDPGAFLRAIAALLDVRLAGS
jgi:adenylosuccinate synthase